MIRRFLVPMFACLIAGPACDEQDPPVQAEAMTQAFTAEASAVAGRAVRNGFRGDAGTSVLTGVAESNVPRAHVRRPLDPMKAANLPAVAPQLLPQPDHILQKYERFRNEHAGKKAELDLLQPAAREKAIADMKSRHVLGK